MKARLMPMIHLPDVRAAALWYRSIGFSLDAWHVEATVAMSSGTPGPDLSDAEGEAGDPWDSALPSYGAGVVMSNAGGRASEVRRREVDLYVDLGQGIDALHEILKDRVEVVEAPYDAFHGNRELIVRDLNGFRITFAQPVTA